jgi:hypothetical protein
LRKKKELMVLVNVPKLPNFPRWIEKEERNHVLGGYAKITKLSKMD